LMKPATLTISAPQGYDLRHMVGFGYHAQGQGFYLAPASGDGKTITLQIMSFSGHGAGTGSDQDVNNQAGQSTGSAEDDLIQQMTQLLQDAKAHGKDMPDTAKMVELMKDFYDKTVKPTLQNAAKDDGQIDAAAAMYLRWWKNAALLGLESDLQSRIDEGLSLLIKGLKNAFDMAAKRCVDNQNINESENMLKRLRQLALLGGDTGGYTLDGKQAEFQRCVRYKLNLDSMITWEMQTAMNITTQVTSSTTLKMDTSEGAMILFRGKGTLQHKNYSIEWTGESAKMNDLCKIQTETKDGTLEAVGRVVWYNLSSKDPKQSTVIAVKPSFLDERMPQWKCDTDVNGGFIQMNVPFSLPLWGAGFDSVHKDIKGSLEGLSDAYLFVDFDYVGGQVVARLAQSKSATVSDAKVTDDITMDVTAAPGAD
jgi:hypothetical protein